MTLILTHPLLVETSRPVRVSTRGGVANSWRQVDSVTDRRVEEIYRCFLFLHLVLPDVVNKNCSVMFSSSSVVISNSRFVLLAFEDTELKYESETSWKQIKYT